MRFLALIVAIAIVLFGLPSQILADPGDDLRQIIAELQKASRDLPRRPDQSDGGILSVGKSHGVLKDLAEGRESSKPAAEVKEYAAIHLATELCRLHPSRGDHHDALAMLGGRRQSRCSADFEFNMLMARLAWLNGNKSDAGNSLSKALQLVRSESEDSAFELFRIGELQIAMDATREARATLQLLKNLPDQAGLFGDGPRRFILIGRLAAKISDEAQARECFAKALRLIEGDDRLNPTYSAAIAQAQAAMGDLETALRTARSSSSARGVDDALLEVAKARLSRSDRAGAEELANDLWYWNKARANFTREVAEGYARDGETKKAIEFVRAAANDWNKTYGDVVFTDAKWWLPQALLGLAAVHARNGDLNAALAIADGVQFPELSSRPITHDDVHFVYRDPSTWSAEYYVGGTLHMVWHQEENAHDLALAAVRCRVALEGRMPTIDAAILQRVDLYKLAFTQASEGDAKSVLGWSKSLPDDRRISALLGAADGLSQFIKGRDHVKQLPCITLSQAERQVLWNKLIQDSREAYPAASRLERNRDEAVAFLKSRVTPLPEISKAEIDSLVSELESSRYQVREAAQSKLTSIGASSERMLRSIQTKYLSLEGQKRLARVFDALAGAAPTTEDANRKLRAIAIVEHIGTPSAKQLLKTWAENNNPTWFSRQARIALDRIGQ